MANREYVSGSSRDTRSYRLSLGVVTILLFAVLWRLGTGAGFFFDEWNFLAYRQGFSPDVLLQPHNGHLVALPNAFYSLLSSVFGVDSYVPFRLLILMVHLGVALMVAVAIGRARGRTMGVATLVVIALMGVGWQNIFWAFQIGFVGSIALFLAGWLLLDPFSKSFSRRRGIAVSFLTLGSLLMSGVGVAALGAIAIVCLVDPRRRIMWWIPVGPATVYGVWHLAYGTSSADLGSADLLPQFALQNAGASAGGIFGLDLAWGQLILGYVIFVVARRRFLGRASAWSFGPAFLYLVFVALATVSRSSYFEPGASRYVYLGVVVLLITAILGGAPPTAPARSGSAIFLGLFAVWGSIGQLTDGANNLKREWRIVSMELAAVEEHRESLDRNLVVDQIHAPQLTVGSYLGLVERLGSLPLPALTEIERSDNETRSGVDALLGSLVEMDVTAYAGEDCVPSGPPTNEVELPAGGSVHVSPWGPGNVSTRRFAPETTRSTSRDFDAAILRFAVPSDSIDLAYRLVFDGQVEVVTCS